MDTRILIASNGLNEAESCRKLLQGEFEEIHLSTAADKAVDDFEATKPNVLILAFESLEAAERYYLGLYRLSEIVHVQAHRTIILCSKDNVRDIYRLCCKEQFDDYVLFWPLTHDAPRLSMAVHHAVRALRQPDDSRALRREIATHIARVAELETILERGFAEHDSQTEAIGKSLVNGHAAVGEAVDRFENSMFEGELAGAVDIKEPTALRGEFGKLRENGVEDGFRPMRESVESMRLWAGSIKDELGPQLDSTRSLADLSARYRPLVLFVDDDKFQHKLLANMLRDENMDLEFAASGVSGLATLRKKRPDLILMDYEMPQFNGIEVVRRLKASAKFGSVPIIMITGKHDREVVGESMKAGADDFIVKPFKRDTLTAKMHRLLGSSGVAPQHDQRPKSVELVEA